MKGKDESVALGTAHEVMMHVRRYYAGSSWAVFEGVANATGGRASRWADALAFGLWPSRGLEIHGVEIKVSRSDLLRELANPHKAEAVASYCDYWWIAAGSDGLAKPDELPPAWGLLVPVSGKRGMRVAKAARQLDPKPLDRGFVAAILRKAAHDYDPERIRQQLHSEIFESVQDKAAAAAAREHQREVEGLRKRIDELAQSESELREQLNRMTTISVAPQMMRRAIGLISTLQGWHGTHGKLESLVRQLERDEQTLAVAKRSLGELRDFFEELAAPQEERA